MCRIASYLGPAIPIENIVTAPTHSLLSQSREAEESKVSLNGDGFGIAWYGDDQVPGLYRECLPAWSDENLKNLCRMVKSPLFIAHVRASTIGETTRTNCHPFVHGRWSFAHNGQIGGFESMQRSLTNGLSDALYSARRGTTDSELLFLLLLQHGLNDNPGLAIGKVITLLEQYRESKTITAPLRLSLVMANGDSLLGIRYASDQHSPTLYQSKQLDNGGIALASEPLDGDVDNWSMLPTNTLFTASSDGVVMHEL